MIQEKKKERKEERSRNQKQKARNEKQERDKQTIKWERFWGEGIMTCWMRSVVTVVGEAYPPIMPWFICIRCCCCIPIKNLYTLPPSSTPHSCSKLLPFLFFPLLLPLCLSTSSPSAGEKRERSRRGFFLVSWGVLGDDERRRVLVGRLLLSLCSLVLEWSSLKRGWTSCRDFLFSFFFFSFGDKV